MTTLEIINVVPKPCVNWFNFININIKQFCVIKFLTATFMFFVRMTSIFFSIVIAAIKTDQLLYHTTHHYWNHAVDES